MPVNKITLKMPDGARALLADPHSSLYKGLYGAMVDIKNTVQRKVKLNLKPGWGSGYSNPPFATGRFDQINRSVVTDQSGLRVLIGSNLVYAEIQEYGGDIVPKKAKALFIPLSDKGRKGGEGLLFGIDFVYSKKVTIKPKGYFSRGMESSFDGITGILKKMLSDLGESAGMETKE
jgi:hypothetical protein